MKVFNLCWAESENNKTFWHVCGMLIQKDDGSFSVKINTLPRPGSKWDGWLSAFERESKKEEAF